jgi:hypothetical protein
LDDRKAFQVRGSRSLAVGLLLRYTKSQLAVGTGNQNLDIPQFSPAPNLQSASHVIEQVSATPPWRCMLHEIGVVPSHLCENPTPRLTQTRGIWHTLCRISADDNLYPKYRGDLLEGVKMLTNMTPCPQGYTKLSCFGSEAEQQVKGKIWRRGVRCIRFLDY